MRVSVERAGLVARSIKRASIRLELTPGMVKMLSAIAEKKRQLQQCRGQFAAAVLVGAAMAGPAAAAGSWSVRDDGRVAEYNAARAAAVSYVNDVRGAMAASQPILRELWTQGQTPAVRAHASRFNALALRGDGIAKPLSPLASCRAVGAAAQQVWSNYAQTELSPERLYSASNAYSEVLRECQSSIDQPPVDSVIVSGPAARASELPADCAVILDVTGTEPPDRGTWSCPASVQAKLGR